MKKKINNELLIIKNARKKSREDEINNFGKLINYRKIMQSKKVYSRKNKKAGTDETLP